MNERRKMAPPGDGVTNALFEGVFDNGEEEDVIDHVGEFEGVDEKEGEIETVEEVLGVPVGVEVPEGVPVLDDVLVGVLEEVGVMEGVIDGVAEPSHNSPVPHTDAGLPHSTEPP